MALRLSSTRSNASKPAPRPFAPFAILSVPHPSWSPQKCWAAIPGVHSIRHCFVARISGVARAM